MWTLDKRKKRKKKATRDADGDWKNLPEWLPLS